MDISATMARIRGHLASRGAEAMCFDFRIGLAKDHDAFEMLVLDMTSGMYLQRFLDGPTVAGLDDDELRSLVRGVFVDATIRIRGGYQSQMTKEMTNGER